LTNRAPDTIAPATYEMWGIASSLSCCTSLKVEPMS